MFTHPTCAVSGRVLSSACTGKLLRGQRVLFDCSAPVRLVCFDTVVLWAKRQHRGVEKNEQLNRESVIGAKTQQIMCHTIDPFTSDQLRH